MNQDPWDQPRTEDRRGPGHEPGAEDSGPRRRRITALIVCLAVVLLAVWYIADSFGSVRALLPDIPFSFGDDFSDDDYDDYNEWFDHFYQENEYDSDFTGEYHIPAADTAQGVTLTLADGAPARTLTLQEIYSKCAPTVAAITAGVDEDSYYWGTGIVMTEDGYILTNAHVIDCAGRVIGVTNMKMISNYSSIEGIGFAIPTTSLKPVTDALLAAGKVSGRPGLGLTVGAIPEQAGSAYELPSGLYISQVSEGSECEDAGIRPGDILTAVNGIPVATTDDVAAIRDTLSVGDEMTLTVWRDGKTFEATIHLMEMSDLYR